MIRTRLWSTNMTRHITASCIRLLKIPMIWRRAQYAKQLSPYISTVCPFKILERPIYARVQPIIDPLLPREQTGFWQGRATVDQVILLTQDIKDSFSAKKKTRAVFVNLTAAYNNSWHRGLTCKLLRLLPDRHMVCMVIKLVGNGSFTLTTGNNKWRRLWRLENGVQQGTVLTPLLFNIHTLDLPTTQARRQDLAAGGPKTKKRGQKPEGGPQF